MIIFAPTLLNSLNWDSDVQIFRVLTRLFNLLPLLNSFNQSSLCRSCRKSAQFHRVVTGKLNWKSFLNTIIKYPCIKFFEFQQTTSIYTHLAFSFKSHNAWSAVMGAISWSVIWKLHISVFLITAQHILVPFS